MKLHNIIYRLSFLALALVYQAAAQEADLGEIYFPTSGSAEAQQHFIQGALLLHSFEYWDARAEFVKAREIDPAFAMAHWGEAMTYNHPIWDNQEKDAGRAALNRLAPTAQEQLAKAPTEREKDFLRTLETLYGEGDKKNRDAAYNIAMKELYDKYPNDVEVACFYALSILGTAQGKRDFRIYMRAGAIAAEIFQKHPRHPGAAHYTIHSFDDPIHAPLGLKAAFAYAGIAPDAPHALHMPSHIFMALGLWDESTASNEASMAASHQQNHHGMHATWWLAYSYLQQGRYQKAQALIAEVEKHLSHSPSGDMRDHLAYMKSAYLVETRQWQSQFYEKDLDPSAFDLKGISSIFLAKGLQAVQLKQTEEAQKILAELKSLPASAARGSDKEQTLPVVIKEMEAAIQLATGLADEALMKMKEAAALQDGLTYEFGPAIPVKPVYELYGEMLLQLNRPQEAAEAFQKALDRDPRRALSLLGLARAAAAAGDKET
ncbi:MAG: hypothetical protein L0Z48_09630, partial [candidate division Zixibacteria bacterium]|nr:hypothetical protein [candidate division Zixibacteria bacterium]